MRWVLSAMSTGCWRNAHTVSAEWDHSQLPPPPKLLSWLHCTWAPPAMLTQRKGRAWSWLCACIKPVVAPHLIFLSLCASANLQMLCEAPHGSSRRMKRWCPHLSCCRQVWGSTLNPSCFSISEGKVLLADINYPSPKKREIHTGSFYTIVIAGKLRQCRLVLISLQLPP